MVIIYFLGKKEYNVPKLNPVNLPLVELQGPGLSLTLKNIDVYGLPDAKITSVKYVTFLIFIKNILNSIN